MRITNLTLQVFFSISLMVPEDTLTSGTKRGTVCTHHKVAKLQKGSFYLHDHCIISCISIDTGNIHKDQHKIDDTNASIIYSNPPLDTTGMNL